MATREQIPAPHELAGGNWLEVLAVFLRLGLTSFGGPVAHLGYFREEFVRRRRWLDDKSYADLVALCQFLPGPAASQVGIAVGLLRADYAGALAPGPVAPCRRRWPWCCLPMESARSATWRVPAGCMG